MKNTNRYINVLVGALILVIVMTLLVRRDSFWGVVTGAYDDAKDAISNTVNAVSGTAKDYAEKAEDLANLQINFLQDAGLPINPNYTVENLLTGLVHNSPYARFICESAYVRGSALPKQKTAAIKAGMPAARAEHLTLCEANSTIASMCGPHCKLPLAFQATDINAPPTAARQQVMTNFGIAYDAWIKEGSNSDPKCAGNNQNDCLEAHTNLKDASLSALEEEVAAAFDQEELAAAAVFSSPATRAAFDPAGSGKFNKHLDGYCLKPDGRDQNSGDKNYGSQTSAECQRLCFDGPHLQAGQTITACEWGPGDVDSPTQKKQCWGHTDEINRSKASVAHSGKGKGRVCWTGSNLPGGTAESSNGPCEVTLYSKKGYEGMSYTTTKDIPRFGPQKFDGLNVSINDNVSSIKMTPGCESVSMYSGGNYGLPMSVATHSIWELPPPINNKMSSMKINQKD